MPTTNLSNRLSCRLRKRRQAALERSVMSSSGASYWNREYAGSMLLSLPGFLATLPSAGQSGTPLSKTLKRPRLPADGRGKAARWRRPNLSVQRTQTPAAHWPHFASG